MQMIEGRQHLEVTRQQHAVAEHVAGHVADADHGDIVAGLDVLAHFPEMAFDRLPGTARGDAHFLVIVAGGAPGREGIAQPEAVIGGNAVGDIGKRGGALIRRDHQIGVVAVVADHSRRRDNMAGDPVVADVQQTANEGLVTGDGFPLQVFPFGRGLLEHETALGADRHDHGVFHHLRLHQAQHLGAEIFTPVRPAQTATRHRPATQMHRFHPRRVHENLEHRARQRQFVDAGGIELEGQIILGSSLRVGLEEVGAQGGLDDVQEPPQNAILIQTADLFQRLLDGHQQGGGVPFGAVAGLGREPGVEQIHQHAGDRRMIAQGAFHVSLAERDAGLQQIPAIGAQHRHVAPWQPRRQHQPVETVVFRLAGPKPGKGILENILDLRGVHLNADILAHVEIQHPQPSAVAGGDFVGTRGQHPQAHPLQHRQHVGQRNWLFGAEDLEAQESFRVFQWSIQPHVQRVGGTNPVQPQNVAHRGAGGEIFLISGGKGLAVALEQSVALFLATLFQQGTLQFFFPGLRGLAQLSFQLRYGILGNLAGLGANGKPELRHDRFVELGGESGRFTVESLHQDVLDPQPHFGVVFFSMHIDQTGNEAVERVLASEQPQPLPFLEVQDAGGDVEQLIVRGLKQIVAWEGLQNVLQGLAGVALGRNAGTGQYPFDLAAQQRDSSRVGVVDLSGEQAQNQLFADDLTVGIEAFDPQIIQRHRAVDGGTGAGLGDDQRFGELGRATQFQRQHGQIAGNVAVVTAQQAETGTGHGAQRQLAVLLQQFVIAVPQKSEVLVGHPTQKFLHVADFRGVQGQLGGFQTGGDARQPFAHDRPVLDGGTHVAQRAQQSRAQIGHQLGIGDPVHLEMHGGFADAFIGSTGENALQMTVGVARHSQHRMDDLVHRETVPIEFHRHGIHQERHVVGDDFHHGVGALPAVFLEAGIVDPDDRDARSPLAAEIPVGQGRAVQIFRGSFEQVLGCHPSVIMAHESLCHVHRRFGQTLPHQFGHTFDQLRRFVREFAGHPHYLAGLLSLSGRHATDTGSAVRFLDGRSGSGARYRCRWLGAMT